MTNLKAVKLGMNKYCGPAVLSILTGKSTDECANVIRSINGQYTVTGVLLQDLLRACDKLGFDQKHIEATGSLYRVLVSIASKRGIYIVQVANHFVCIEVSDKLYFCDNHTKEPMPAASSARLIQPTYGVYQVIERPKSEEQIERERLEAIRRELNNTRAKFKQRLDSIFYSMMSECHRIGNAIGDISVSEANEAVVKLFEEKVREIGYE